MTGRTECLREKMTCSLAPADASWASEFAKERRPVMDRDVGDHNDPMARQQPALVAMGWTRPKDDVEALDQLGWRRGMDIDAQARLRAARRSSTSVLKSTTPSSR